MYPFRYTSLGSRVLLRSFLKIDGVDLMSSFFLPVQPLFLIFVIFAKFSILNSLIGMPFNDCAAKICAHVGLSANYLRVMCLKLKN